jgi:hypothetical protein
VRRTKGCPKCARGEGQAVSVLTVTYPGGRTQQISVRRSALPCARAEQASSELLTRGREQVELLSTRTYPMHARSPTK